MLQTVEHKIVAYETQTDIIHYIQNNGRVELSDLLANVFSATGCENWNEFISVVEKLDTEKTIMAACITDCGPQYQMFTFAFTPATVDYDKYYKRQETLCNECKVRADRKPLCPDCQNDKEMSQMTDVKRGAGEDIKLSDRVRSDRKSQVLTGKVEYVSGWNGNITQEGFEGPYAVLSLANGKTKVRVIGGDSTMLKLDDIVRVEVGNPTNEARGMWNTTMDAIPTVLERNGQPEDNDSTVLPDDNDEPSVEQHGEAETTATDEAVAPQTPQGNHLDSNVLNEAAILRWQRPTNDDKLSDKMGITKEQVVELTETDEYVKCVEQVLLDSIDTPSGKIKMKNYIRMAVQYRKVCVKQALARKMHIGITDAERIFARIEGKL